MRSASAPWRAGRALWQLSLLALHARAPRRTQPLRLSISLEQFCIIHANENRWRRRCSGEGSPDCSSPPSPGDYLSTTLLLFSHYYAALHEAASQSTRLPVRRTAQAYGRRDRSGERNTPLGGRRRVVQAVNTLQLWLERISDQPRRGWRRRRRDALKAITDMSPLRSVSLR